MRKLILIIFVVIVLVFITTCDIQKSVDPISNNARIILGESIDGIHLGEYVEEVEARLGSKTLWGWADGTRSWTIFTWPDSPYSGLQVYFIEMDVGEYGPADYLGVEEPYSGTTYEGIGIGSHLTDAHREWGEPERTNEGTPYISYTYDLNEKNLFLRFKDSLLEYLQFGPFIPYNSIDK